ncbi:MAG: adenine deaminase C-terminal domain-containing protein [Syntrophorhabdus sp.]
MFEKTFKDLKDLISVSTSDKAPDCVIQGGSVFDVFTGEIVPADIWMSGKWIAYVGPSKSKPGDNTKIIDARGLIAVPGYIDAHGHSDLFYNPATFSDIAITTGTTTVFSDGHDCINPLGAEGFKEILKYSGHFNIKYIWGLPATYPPYPEVEGGDILSMYDIWDLFAKYPECVSLSEVSPYLRIVKNEDNILQRMLLARSMGRNIEGHTLGASYDRLNAIAASGVTSCHESIRPHDIKSRIRLGFYTMVRSSSIRNDLKDLCPTITALPKDTVILVSDGLFAADLVSKGYMDHIIGEAISFGLSPSDAIRMATLNPARYFRMDHAVGSITPGRIADVLLLENIEKPSPVKVFERGTLAAENGILKRNPAFFPLVGTEHYPYAFGSVTAEDFAIGSQAPAPIPVIDIIDRTVTRRLDMDLPRGWNQVLADPQADVRKIVYSRREAKKWGKGFVRGFGTRAGAVASTVAHETHGLVVHGFDDNDMALAANTVLAMKGGFAVAHEGRVLGALPLPIGAVMSKMPVGELGEAYQRINEILQSMGSNLDDPIWTTCFLTFTSIVELRITVSGVYDVRRGVVVF